MNSDISPISIEDQIKEAYLQPGALESQIAKQFKVSLKDLKDKARLDGWDRERAELMLELGRASEEQLAQYRATNGVEDVINLHMANNKVVKMAGDSLDDIDDNMDLKSKFVAIERAAKTIAAATAVSSRLMALSGPTQKVEMEVAGSVGFMGGGAPMLPQKNAIEVDAVDVEVL